MTSPKISDPKTGEIQFLVSSVEKPGEVYSVSADAVTYHPLESQCAMYDTCHSCQEAYPNCGWCYDSSLNVITDLNTTPLSRSLSFYVSGFGSFFVSFIHSLYSRK